jgi:hypothetical protein
MRLIHLRTMDDDDLRLALSAIEPRGRELFRRYLIADQPDRDATCNLYGWPQTSFQPR